MKTIPDKNEITPHIHDDNSKYCTFVTIGDTISIWIEQNIKFNVNAFLSSMEHYRCFRYAQRIVWHCRSLCVMHRNF